MPATLTPEDSEDQKRRIFSQKRRKDKKTGNISSRPVSWPQNYHSEQGSSEPENAASQEEGKDQPSEADSVQEQPDRSAGKPSAQNSLKGKDEEEEDDYERQLRAAKQEAKDRIKKEIRKKAIQATKVAAKALWRAVIVPVLSAIGGFIAATWYIWLILAAVIILIVLGYAYGQEIWDKIPSWIKPSLEVIINQFI